MTFAKKTTQYTSFSKCRLLREEIKKRLRSSTRIIIIIGNSMKINHRKYPEIVNISHLILRWIWNRMTTNKALNIVLKSLFRKIRHESQCRLTSIQHFVVFFSRTNANRIVKHVQNEWRENGRTVKREECHYGESTSFMSKIRVSW